MWKSSIKVKWIRNDKNKGKRKCKLIQFFKHNRMTCEFWIDVYLIFTEKFDKLEQLLNIYNIHCKTIRE